MTSIVLIHTGGGVPPYVLECVRQIRKWFSGDVYLGLYNVDGYPHEIEQSFGVKVVNVNPVGWLEDGLKLSERLGVFGLLFARATARLFLLQRLISDLDLHNIIHIENDVMIYIDPSTIQWPTSGISINPISEEFGTWAFTHVSSPKDLQFVNTLHCEILQHNLDDLKHRFNSDTVNEMLFAGEFIRNKIVNALPTLPQDGVDLLFDGSAYGQYAGGTNVHPAGFAERGRYVGEALLDKKIDLAWKADEQNKRYPVCLDLINGTETRLANLHIHCKKLHKFKS